MIFGRLAEESQQPGPDLSLFFSSGPVLKSARERRVRVGREVQVALDAHRGGEGVVGPLCVRRLLELQRLGPGEEVDCVSVRLFCCQTYNNTFVRTPNGIAWNAGGRASVSDALGTGAEGRSGISKTDNGPSHK